MKKFLSLIAPLIAFQVQAGVTVPSATLRCSFPEADRSYFLMFDNSTGQNVINGGKISECSPENPECIVQKLSKVSQNSAGKNWPIGKYAGIDEKNIAYIFSIEKALPGNCYKSEIIVHDKTSVDFISAYCRDIKNSSLTGCEG